MLVTIDTDRAGKPEVYVAGEVGDSPEEVAQAYKRALKELKKEED